MKELTAKVQSAMVVDHDGGGGGRRECRRLEDLVGKDAGVITLVDGDRRRLTLR